MLRPLAPPRTFLSGLDCLGLRRVVRGEHGRLGVQTARAAVPCPKRNKNTNTIVIIKRRAMIVALPRLSPRVASTHAVLTKRNREREREKQREREIDIYIYIYRERERQRENTQRWKKKRDRQKRQRCRQPAKKYQRRDGDLGEGVAGEVQFEVKERVRDEATQREIQTIAWFAFPQRLREKERERERGRKKHRRWRPQKPIQ